MIGLPFSIRIHTLLNFQPKASATAGNTIFPFTIFKPFFSPGSFSQAFSQPRSANLIAYGSVALVNAKVEVHGTAPGIFATQ